MYMEEEIDGLSNYRGERALSCVERLIGGISPEAFYDRFVYDVFPVLLIMYAFQRVVETILRSELFVFPRVHGERWRKVFTTNMQDCF